VEDRISELEDKIDIKEKIEELLEQRLRSYKRNMQELRLHQKTKLVNHGHWREEEVQAKGVHMYSTKW
jgi:hypothetical protein